MQPRVIQRAATVPGLAQMIGVPRPASASSGAGGVTAPDTAAGAYFTGLGDVYANTSLATLTTSYASDGLAVVGGPVVGSYPAMMAVMDTSVAPPVYLTNGYVNSTYTQALDGGLFSRLADNKFISGYYDNNSGLAYVNIINITRSSVTPQTPVQLTYAGIPFMLGLTDSVALAFQNANGFLATRISISGNVPTPGSSVRAITAISAPMGYAAKLSDTQAICVYKNGSDTYLYAAVVTVDSSGGISFGSPVQLPGTAGAQQCTVSALSATKAIFEFTDAGSVIACKILNISGTTVTPLSSVTLTSAGSPGAVLGMTANRAVVYWSHSSTSVMYACVISVSDTDVISYGPTNQIATSATGAKGLAYISKNKMFCAAYSTSSIRAHMMARM